MRGATGLILSVLSLVGFACTGQDKRGDGHAGGAGDGLGGGAGSGGVVGGRAGRANGGTSGDGGSVVGGAGGDASGTGGGGPTGGGEGGGGGIGVAPSVLVFSRTTGFRHASIVDGVSALGTLAMARGWELVATEEPSVFDDDAGVAPFNVVVFLCTSGDVLDSDQEATLERFVRAGNGWVGIHSASDTEYTWPFYGGLVGAYFREHPEIQEARVRVETAEHPSTATLPATFLRIDEWYAFLTNPRPNVTVLLTLDESSYVPGTSTMGTDHPIAWFHDYEGGRAFYTALGHTRESYAEPNFLAHVAGAIEWAAGRD